MERIEAEQLVARLRREHAHDSSRFFARENSDGSWSVVKARIPDTLRGTTLKITGEHSPPRPFADDRRSGHEIRVPGLPGGLG